MTHQNLSNSKTHPKNKPHPKSFNFTNLRIKQLPLPERESRASDLEFSDQQCQGLKVLIGKTGNRRFLLRYSLHGKKRSIGIGRFPEIDVTVARKQASEYKRMIHQGDDPALKEQQQNEQRMTVDVFFEEHYLPYAKKQKRSWKDDVDRYHRHLAPVIGKLAIKQVTALQLQQIQLDVIDPNRKGRVYAVATCNRIMALYKAMNSHAHRWGLVEVNEAAKIKLFKEDNTRQRFFSVDEMQSIIKAAVEFEENYYHGAYIALLLLTGLRTSELRLAKWQDLDVDRSILFIPITKNGKSREVYLSELAVNVIKKLTRLGNNPYLFAGTKAGKPISPPRVNYEKILDNAEIKDRDEVCFHTTRHSVGSALVEAGLTLFDVKAQLGHSCIQSSERYAKLTTNRMKNTSNTIASLIKINHSLLVMN